MMWWIDYACNHPATSPGRALMKAYILEEAYDRHEIAEQLWAEAEELT